MTALSAADCGPGSATATVAAAAATLAGLLFVAVSINLRQIPQIPGTCQAAPGRR